jgi:hypothetical protein
MNSLLQNFVLAGRPETSLVTVRALFAGWLATFVRGIRVVSRCVVSAHRRLCLWDAARLLVESNKSPADAIKGNQLRRVLVTGALLVAGRTLGAKPVALGVFATAAFVLSDRDFVDA